MLNYPSHGGEERAESTKRGRLLSGSGRASLRAAGALASSLLNREGRARIPNVRILIFLSGAGTKGAGAPSKEAQGWKQKCYKEISGKAEPAAATDGKGPENQLFSAIWELKKKTTSECFSKELQSRKKFIAKN